MTQAGYGLDPDDIFNVTAETFDSLALRMWHWHKANHPLYNRYSRLLRADSAPASVTDIAMLPISFFKTHEIRPFPGQPAEVFTSSGTTGMQPSRHTVKDLSWYERSFMSGFRLFYGNPADRAILCLLPAYLERQGSSLVYMAEKLVAASGQADSGFFLGAEGRMLDILRRREAEGLPTLLLGVTFALLDLAEQHPMPLRHTVVMETGGMKGRRRELTRAELHEKLQQAFQLDAIHSEYGMTELLSQAYSHGGGIYRCPPWMRVLVREDDDPRSIRTEGLGLLCVIDLANRWSCPFIETADLARVYADGSFEVLGRIDHADIRGCSLLAL